jgi:hypothetical protein
LGWHGNDQKGDCPPTSAHGGAWMGMGRKPRVSRCGPEARAPAGLHDAGRRPAPPRDCTMRAGGPRPHGVARCGPEARAPTGSHDAGRRLAPPRGRTMRAGGWRPRGRTMRIGGCRLHGGARCGPEARAPTGSHDAGRRPAPPRGCTGRESSAVGARCSSAALRWCIIRSAKNHT